LVAPIVGYVRHQIEYGKQVTVLLSEVEPTRRRYQLLHNQRGLILAAALRSRTDAVVATLAFRLNSHERSLRSGYRKLDHGDQAATGGVVESDRSVHRLDEAPGDREA
jgi:hypothetical protein